jgi:uncharacterized BrkB/YihY/UPF0761 family membrane protein
MLSEKDKEFIQYWEKQREKHNSFGARLMNGLPMAVLFCVPILLFITVVYLFFPEWYTRVSNRLPGSLVTIVIAVITAVLFFSYFRMQFKWESNEQLYRELKHKAGKTGYSTESN